MKLPFESIKLADLVARGEMPYAGLTLSEKIDGRTVSRDFDGCTVWGDALPDGRLFLWDCTRAGGEDISNRAGWLRMVVVREIMERVEAARGENINIGRAVVPRRPNIGAETQLCPTEYYSRLNWHLPRYPFHGETAAQFATRIIESGGEGIVGMQIDAPFFSTRYKVKRLETFFCVVTSCGGNTQSVEVVLVTSDEWRVTSGETAPLITHHSSLITSRVALRSGKCDRVRVGSIIKVEGVGLTAAGRIREPRPCADSPQSWLVRY